jgi:hypothetical protein
MARNKKAPFEYRADETLAAVHKRFLKHWNYLKNKRFLNRLWKLFLTDYVEYVKFECGYLVRIPGSYDVIQLGEDYEITNYWHIDPVGAV